MYLIALWAAAGLAVSPNVVEIQAALDNALLEVERKTGTALVTPKGEAGGQIVASDGTFVIVSTGKNEIRVPANVIQKGRAGPVVALSAAEVDTIMDAARKAYQPAKSLQADFWPDNLPRTPPKK